MHQQHEQRDERDHRHRIDHGVRQAGPAHAEHAVDELDVWNEQEDRDEQPDVEDIAGDQGHRAALDDVRQRHRPLEDLGDAGANLRPLRLGMERLAPEHQDLEQAGEHANDEDGDRDVERGPPHPEQKVH